MLAQIIEDPWADMVHLAKYFLAKGRSVGEIRAMLRAFQCRHDIPTDTLDYANKIESAIRYAKKHPLVEISAIPFTKVEMDKIWALGSDALRKVAFAALCVAKYRLLCDEKNNGWVNLSYKEMFKLANTQQTTVKQCDTIRRLNEAGLTRINKKAGSLNVQVLFIENDGKVVLEVQEMVDLGNQYLAYVGKPYVHCQECGRWVRTTATRINSVKYCQDCARTVRLRQMANAKTRKNSPMVKINATKNCGDSP